MRWLTAIIRHWREQRIRTKKTRDLYRTYERNRTILDNGGTL